MDNSDLSGMRVLLVDDDEGCREFLAVCLKYEKVEVTQATSAEDAVAILRDYAFDAVATDLSLPDMDGIELLSHIRKNVGDVPVILITGHSSVGSAVEALKHGAQDYLIKPLDDGSRLTQAIWRAVDHHKLTCQNRALQEKLLQSEKMESLAVLTGGVAHDLNNVLLPMLSLPDVMINDIERVKLGAMDPLDRISSNLQLIKASAKRAAGVVRDLITSSRRVNYKTKPIDMNDLVHLCLEAHDVQQMIESRPSVELVASYADTLPGVAASEAHLLRAISNLVRNGVESMDKDDEEQDDSPAVIKVSTSVVTIEEPLLGFEVVSPGSYVVVKIEDSGSGIAEEDMQRMFEPFFTRKKQSKESGSGLGLSVVHGVIKDHNGFVDVKSCLKSGTTFSLYFPVAKETTASAIQDEGDAIGGEEHVLVVDDEPTQRTVAKTLLESLGYKVTTAGSGREAVSLFEYLSRHKKPAAFDLILLDMIMEDDFDGLATHEAISRLYPGMNTLMASGYSPTERARQAVGMHVNWLAKPYDMDTLARAVRRACDSGPEKV